MVTGREEGVALEEYVVLLYELCHIVVPLLTLTRHLVAQQFLNTLQVLFGLSLLFALHNVIVEELDVLEDPFDRVVGEVLLQIVILVLDTLQL